MDIKSSLYLSFLKNNSRKHISLSFDKHILINKNIKTLSCFLSQTQVSTRKANRLKSCEISNICSKSNTDKIIIVGKSSYTSNETKTRTHHFCFISRINNCHYLTDYLIGTIDQKKLHKILGFCCNNAVIGVKFNGNDFLYKDMIYV